jgi:large-conductance mechanosensitive channel
MRTMRTTQGRSRNHRPTNFHSVLRGGTQNDLSKFRIPEWSAKTSNGPEQSQQHSHTSVPESELRQQPEPVSSTLRSANQVDRLGYSIYADALVRQVMIVEKENNRSLSVGLFAPWGSGKSFLMEAIKAEYDARYESEQGQVEKQKDDDGASLRGTIKHEYDRQYKKWVSASAQIQNKWVDMATVMIGMAFCAAVGSLIGYSMTAFDESVKERNTANNSTTDSTTGIEVGGGVGAAVGSALVMMVVMFLRKPWMKSEKTKKNRKTQQNGKKTAEGNNSSLLAELEDQSDATSASQVTREINKNKFNDERDKVEDNKTLETVEYMCSISQVVSFESTWVG